MTLKDASAYNVLFDGSRPVLIDALSFERRTEDEPWVAYRQFCQHFLAPLALMAQRDVRIGLLLRDFIDGVPLDLAADLLPVSSRVRLGLGTHLHLHARAQRQHAADPDRGGSGRPVRLSRARLEALVESLHATVAGLRWEPRGTEWSDYGETTSYSPTAAAAKRQLVQRFLAKTDGQWIWDLGANTGVFSALAAESGRRVVALDADHAASEQHYRSLRRSDSPHILPLVMDLANPSPALGWALEERRSLVERGPADVILALALVHHLAIGNNVPLDRIASLFARLGRRAIVEFVPKQDPMTQHLLAVRPDIFPDYSADGFRAAFSARFRVVEETAIEESQRTLFLLEAR